MTKKKGLVYLIGAGPGDPGLITVKGKECLEKADVIVYDYLVNKVLLGYGKEGAERVYVGKERKSREIPQEQINQILIDKANLGCIVARLKGGDPFIFGRGGEEAEALAASGIPFEIIPGITSVSAVPAYAGIPLTHRNFTSSFIVATGHEDPDKEESALSWEALAKTGTVVFLMGTRNIEENMKRLISNGKPLDTPAAIISWGTLPRQKTLIGTVENIGGMAKTNRIKPPGIVIVGEVVNLRDTINWFETKPLFGKKVLVTRARRQASAFAKLLEEQGAEVIEFPTIEIVPLSSWDGMDKAIARLSTYSWIVFTSVNGVEFFFNRLRELKKDFRELHGVKIAVIGEQTAKAIDSLGLQVDVMPDDYRAEGLIECFKNNEIKGKSILIPRAKEAREILPVELEKMGAHVDLVTAYETRKPNPDKVEEIKEMLLKGEIDFITFASSSTAKNFIALVGKDRKLLSKSILACIGPITAQSLIELGIEPQIVCKKYTIEELAKEISIYSSKSKQKD